MDGAGLRVAMAQTVVSPAAPDAGTVGAARDRVASQIAEAAARGARLARHVVDRSADAGLLASAC